MPRIVYGQHHVAFVTHHLCLDCAVVEVRHQTHTDANGKPQLGAVVERYETAPRGACASARRSMKKLAAARPNLGRN